MGDEYEVGEEEERGGREKEKKGDTHQHALQGDRDVLHSSVLGVPLQTRRVVWCYQRHHLQLLRLSLLGESAHA